MPSDLFNFAGLMQSLNALDSFRLTIAAGSISAKMALTIRPQKALALMNGDAIRPSLIRLGVDRAWIDEGAGEYRELPATLVPSLGPYLFDELPKDFVTINDIAVDLNLNLGALAAYIGPEPKNGFAADHYRIVPNPLTVAFLPLSAGMAMDIWTAGPPNALHLVRYVLAHFGSPIVEVDVSHPNDPANTVSPPSIG